MIQSEETDLFLLCDTNAKKYFYVETVIIKIFGLMIRAFLVKWLIQSSLIHDQFRFFLLQITGPL